MENNNKTALKAGTWYVFSNFLIQGMGLLTTPIITRLLSPVDFGITITYNSWVAILTVIGTLNIYSCVQIARHDYTDEEMDSFLSAVLTLSSMSLLLLYIVVKSLGSIAINFFGMPSILIDFMFLSILFSNGFTILQTKHKAYMKYKEFVRLSIIIAITSPILSIFFITLQDSNLYLGRIVGNNIVKIILSFFIFVHILKKGKTLYNEKYWKYALNISIPLIPHLLSTNVLSHSDRIMINNFRGPTEVGLYSLAYSYSSVLSIVWTSFNQAWVPWFYGKMKEENFEEIKKYVRPYIIVFSIVFLFMLFTGPELLKLLGPKEYWSGKWVIPPVLLGLYFQFVYSLYVNIEFYIKKTKYIAYGSLFAAIVNVVLNILFIPLFGYISAAYTTLVGYVLIFLLHYFISKHWLKEDIYGIKFILRWTLFIIILTVVAMLLYNQILIRYILLLVIMIMIIFKQRKKINVIVNLVKKKIK